MTTIAEPTLWERMVYVTTEIDISKSKVLTYGNHELDEELIEKIMNVVGVCLIAISLVPLTIGICIPALLLPGLLVSSRYLPAYFDIWKSNIEQMLTLITYPATYKKSKRESALEIISSYLHVLGPVAEVIPEKTVEKNFKVRWVNKPDNKPKSLSYLITTLKIISYCTVIFPLVILGIKAALQIGWNFEEISADEEKLLRGATK